MFQVGIAVAVLLLFASAFSPALCMSAETLNAKGIKAFNNGDFRRAITLYSEAMAVTPNDAALYHNRGLSEYKLANYPAALGDFDKALTLDPKNPAILSSRGGLHVNMKHFAEAMSDFNKAIELQPQVPAHLENLKRATVAFTAHDTFLRSTTSNRYSAVAISPSNKQAWSGVDKWSSQAGAEVAALLNCRKLAADCKLLVSTANQCLALVVRDIGWTTGVGANETAARDQAYNTCRQSPGQCSILYSGCSLPYVPPVPLVTQPVVVQPAVRRQRPTIICNTTHDADLPVWVGGQMVYRGGGGSSRTTCR